MTLWFSVRDAKIGKFFDFLITPRRLIKHVLTALFHRMHFREDNLMLACFIIAFM